MLTLKGAQFPRDVSLFAVFFYVRCTVSYRDLDETYMRVKGEWVYLSRAVDKFGKTLDFMLSRRRNKKVATTFFARALERNGLPRSKGSKLRT